jgi:flavin reductase (DIM6/NTAB) family NADH-FMN oxidoreductase RutF
MGLPRRSEPRTVQFLRRALVITLSPAVFECRLHQQVRLGEGPNTLVIGEVVGVRLAPGLPLRNWTMSVPSDALRPVGRLSGSDYMLAGGVRVLPRP